ncbi:MAG: FAD-binding protein [Holdemania filiformis]
MACSRPVVENGRYDVRRQIGLSGRTVKPKLILTFGISGAIQFTAGMKGAEKIIAVNTDPQAPIFDLAHVAVVGDAGQIAENMLKEMEGETVCSAN